MFCSRFKVGIVVVVVDVVEVFRQILRARWRLSMLDQGWKKRGQGKRLHVTSLQIM